MSDLNARLLAAHAARDKAALVQLYAEAADARRDENAVAFYLTHAYVYGLEIGHADTPALRRRLVDMGREPPAP